MPDHHVPSDAGRHIAIWLTAPLPQNAGRYHTCSWQAQRLHGCSFMSSTGMHWATAAQRESDACCHKTASETLAAVCMSAALNPAVPRQYCREREVDTAVRALYEQHICYSTRAHT